MNEKQGVSAWLRGIIGRYEDEAHAPDGGCPTMVKMFGIDCEEETYRSCMVKMMTAIADRIDAERALPEGMEWPRFEDGELVKVGDEVEYKDETMRVYLATFDSDGWALWCSREGIDGRLSGSFGERVKRPAPKVLDADGVPIKVGDTVYCNGEDEPLRVSHITDSIKVTLINSHASYCTVNPSRLSHERPDSWEKLEEDANQTSCRYFGIGPENSSCDDCPYGSIQTGRACWQNAHLDLVRRAKALAKAGEVE